MQNCQGEFGQQHTWQGENRGRSPISLTCALFFPQLSTVRNLVLVTHNLYREFQKEQASYMCERVPHQVSSTDLRSQIEVCPRIAEPCLQIEPNSLLQNILE